MIPDTAAQARFQNFLKIYHGKKLVVLELGIGWRNQLIKASDDAPSGQRAKRHLCDHQSG